MNWIPQILFKVAADVKAAGGRAFLVGGSVRDHLLGLPPKDFDTEVYGIPSQKLFELLRSHGDVNAVGESFQVYKLFQDYDFSLPRKDKKTGKGHRGFEVSGDPFLGFDEATRRRDFTVNAMMLDILTGELIDLHGGRQDLELRLLRSVDEKTFGEDSLRVLRAAQLAARFEFEIEEKTMTLCQSIGLEDLPAERIWQELRKILLIAKRPSLGFHYLYKLGVIKQLFLSWKLSLECPKSLNGIQRVPWMFTPHGHRRSSQAH